MFLGLDVGSTSSKCVLTDEAGEIIATGFFNAGAGTAGPTKAIDQAFLEAGATFPADVERSCATGYGRHLFDWADDQVSELTCHAKGASRIFDHPHTVIDIGGQDAKVLSLDDGGNLKNFVMNDKCAAGTGRFLEVMARIFGVDVSELSDLDQESTEAVSISSTCTVFAESEVISKLAAGNPIPSIVAGIHASVVDRTVGLVRRVGMTPPVVMTGGVAYDASLRRRLEERLGVSITTSPLAQLAGAYGAALIAGERARKV